MRNCNIQILHDLHIIRTNSGDLLFSFSCCKRHLHIIAKVSNHTPPNLFPLHACACSEFLKQGVACKYIVSLLVAKRLILIPPELNTTQISRLP